MPAMSNDPGASDAPASDPEVRHGSHAAWRSDDPAFEAAVLRAFIRDGRLVSIPAKDRKKLVVYRFLVDRVLPDPVEAVAERDLNMRLALWHPDVATIRRALIDYGLATRDGMTYRRAMPRG